MLDDGSVSSSLAEDWKLKGELSMLFTLGLAKENIDAPVSTPGDAKEDDDAAVELKLNIISLFAMVVAVDGESKEKDDVQLGEEVFGTSKENSLEDVQDLGAIKDPLSVFGAEVIENIS